MGVLRRSGVVVESTLAPMNVHTGVARPSRLYAANGVTLKQLCHLDSIGSDLASCTACGEAGADRDTFETTIYARGNETKLSISTATGPTSAKWDLIVNGVLDSAGYDDYTAGSGIIDRLITFTRKINPGYNLITCKVNGRNAASTNWWITFGGMSVQ